MSNNKLKLQGQITWSNYKVKLQGAFTRWNYRVKLQGQTQYIMHVLADCNCNFPITSRQWQGQTQWYNGQLLLYYLVIWLSCNSQSDWGRDLMDKRLDFIVKTNASLPTFSLQTFEYISWKMLNPKVRTKVFALLLLLCTTAAATTAMYYSCCYYCYVLLLLLLLLCTTATTAMYYCYYCYVLQLLLLLLCTTAAATTAMYYSCCYYCYVLLLLLLLLCTTAAATTAMYYSCCYYCYVLLLLLLLLCTTAATAVSATTLESLPNLCIPSKLSQCVYLRYKLSARSIMRGAVTTQNFSKILRLNLKCSCCYCCCCSRFFVKSSLPSKLFSCFS